MVRLGLGLYGLLGAATLLALTYVVLPSRLGLRFLALREDETGAEHVGIHVRRLKVAAFVTSAFFAGVAGAIHATYLSYIDPLSAFDLRYTLIPIVMTFFGGLGTVAGPLVGGSLLQLVNDYVWANVLQLNMAVFGLILVLLILFLPRGVVDSLKDLGYLPRTRRI